MSLLSLREEKVLAAVIERHVASAEPVSSKHLCEHYGFPYSSATVRNILASLEDKGFLNHPYTSAGKVPTAKAYRFFVETLLPRSGTLGVERQRIFHELCKHVREVDQLISLTAKVLAVSSRLLAVTLLQHPAEQRLAHLQLAALSSHRILLMIHTVDGDEFHQVFASEEAVSLQVIKQVAVLVNQKAKGRTSADLNRLAKGAWPGVNHATLRLVRRALDVTGMHLSGLGQGMRIEGAANLMEQPEFNTVSATRQLAALLDQRETLMRSLQAPGIEQQGVRVVINEHAFFESLPALSLVMEEIASPSRRSIRIGVVGPTRMAYGRIIPLVKNTADALAEIINNQ